MRPFPWKSPFAGFTAGKLAAGQAAGLAGANPTAVSRGLWAALKSAPWTGASIALLLVLLGGIFGIRLSRRPPEPPKPPRPVPRSPLKRILLNPALIVLSLVSLVLLVFGVVMLYDNFGPVTVTIAAGGERDESYALLQGFKSVVMRNHPNISVVIRQTMGGSENLRLLDSGVAQLAAVGAGIVPGPKAKSVATLYNEAFQLVVRKGSPVDRLQALKGKRIAVPKGSNSYQALLAVATGYGLKEGDFAFAGGDDQSADRAFMSGEADARFIVGPLNNPGMARIVAGGDAVFVPLDLGAALRFALPNYLPITIPPGVYSGSPAEDVPSTGTRMSLLARSDTANSVVSAFADAFTEHRQELVSAVAVTNVAGKALVAQVSPPVGPDAPVHPGAEAYYASRGASFLSAHAELLVFVVLTLAAFALWLVELRRFASESSKDFADQYNRKVLDLMEEAQSSATRSALTPILNELTALMTSAAEDLEKGKLSEQSFACFGMLWQTAAAVVRERNGKAIDAIAAAQDVETRSESQPVTWSLAHYLRTSSRS